MTLSSHPYNIIVLHEILDGSVGNFEDISHNCLSHILSHGHKWRSISDALDRDRSYGGRIMTFDDGHKSDYDIVLPMLSKVGASATFFIVPAFVGQPGFMTWDDIRHLHLSGMEIGSHSLSHPDFRKIDEAEARREFVDSKNVIELQIGAPVSSFAFPFGFAPKRFFSMARSVGYRYILGSRHGVVRANRDLIMPRNSIHSGMSLNQISAALDARILQRIGWMLEDISKVALKKILPMPIYYKLRGFWAGTRG